MPEDDTPKSAYELVLDRLRKKDREAGVEERPLTDAQRTAIAEVRKIHEAKLAEREILHRSACQKAQEPEELEKLEEQYRRDRERFAAERDRKVEEIRARGA